MLHPLKLALLLSHQPNTAHLLGARRESSDPLGQGKLPDEWELYDITADRVERDDLAGRHTDMVRKLASEWDAPT